MSAEQGNMRLHWIVASVGRISFGVSMVIVTVHLRKDVADELDRDTPILPETIELMTALAKHGVRLQPLHPGIGDDELRTHFFAALAKPSKAEKLTKLLATFPSVVAAYVKPPDDAP